MPAWFLSAVVVGLLLCSTMVDAHAFLSYPAPRGQFANPPKRVDEEEAPTGTSPNDQAFVCRNDPQMPLANWASLTAGQSQPITITYDAPHIGDCFVYLTYDGDKAFSDMKWFKIWERHECHNSTNFDIPIPSYLPTGSHVIFRWEWYALHQYPNFIEYYAQCVDATISGSASGQLPQPQVNMPGHLPSAVSAYWDPYAYPEEPMIFTGPAVATLNGASSTTGSNTAPTSTPKPTSTPTTSPTSKPTSAPTTTPTSTPTSKPTSTPTNPPTSAPTNPPTNPPTSGGSASNIKVGLNSGTTNWWIGVVVSGGGETTVKVEMMDSGSFSNWVTLTDQSYAFVYEAPSVLTLPISLRLTSSTGKQAILSNVITSFYLAGLVDSGKSYSSSSTSAPTTSPTTKPTSAPTSTPTTKPTSTPTSTPTTKPTSAPTSVPTNKPTSVPTSAPPTTKPTTGNPKVNIYSDSNEWWLAVTISGTTESISKIELKDAGTRTTYQALTNAGWAYTFSSQGVALVTPLTVKVTTASGKVTSVTMSNITPGASLETTSQ